ncbi:MAG: tetratricopeptide repeat protein [Cyclobacteriaceae bacterium]|nr:tetratricopeptide repeat protein [Cyclobacteriaceae bacterium]
MLTNVIYKSLTVLIFIYACSCTGSGRKNADESFKQLISDNQRLVNDNPDSAIMQINNSILLARDRKVSDTVFTHLYFQGANAWLFKNQYDSAKRWLQLCLAHNTTGNIGKVKAKVYSRYGLIAWYEGNFEESLRYQKISLSESENLKDSFAISSALNNIGIVYDRMGAMVKAADYHFKSLSIRQKINDTTNISHSLVNLAIINQQLKDYPLALKQFLHAKEKLPKRVPPFIAANVLTNIGHTFYLLKSFDSARHYQKQSYAIRKNMGNKLGEAACLQRLALVALAQKNTDTAMVYANQALQIQLSIKDKTGVVLTRQTLSKIYNERNQSALANASALEAYRLADSLKLWKIKTEIAHDIIKSGIIPASEKEYWFEKLLESKDSLNDYESKRHLVFLESELETEKKDNQVRILSFQNDRQQANIRQQNVLIVCSVSILFILLLAYLKLKRAKHAIEVANLKLTQTNQLLDTSKNALREAFNEKEVLLKELQHRVKNNFQLIASLLQLQERGIGNDTDKKLIKEFRSRITGMAVLHQKFYNSTQMEWVNVQDYVRDLLQNLMEVSMVNKNEIQVLSDIEPVKLPFGKAMALGLLINELFVNSVKYAKTPGQLLEVSVKYLRLNPMYNRLVFSDNGEVNDIIPKSKTGSMGFELIDTLTQQLEDSHTYQINKGITWTIEHKINYTSL